MPKASPANIEEQVTQEIEAEEAKATPSEAKETPKPAESATIKPDPNDLEVELEGGKKVKMSELKKGYMMHSDYTTKTQQLAEQKKEVEELANLANYLKSNPKKLERIIAILDEKEEAIAGQREEIKDELSGLDPDDPVAKKLKAQDEQLKKLQSQLETFTKQQENSQKETLVQQAQQVLTKTLEEVAKEYKFEDDEEKGLWRMMVLSFLKDNPKQYVDEADFQNTIKEIGKKYFDTLTKLAEKKVAKYVQSKGGKVPVVPEVPGSPLKKKPSMDNLQEIIEEELTKEEATNK